MESSNYSLGDIAALLGNRSGFGNGDGLGWLILIFLFFGAMGGGWNRNPGPAVPPNVATVTDVQGMINNQTVNTGLNNIALATADNNYQTAQLINGQTNILQQQEPIFDPLPRATNKCARIGIIDRQVDGTDWV